MKTIIVLSLPALFALLSPNGNGKSISEDQGDYCARMLDGRLVIMHEGAIMVTEVRFANGTELKPDGSITAKDGTRSMLKDGECVDKSGIRDPGMKESKKEKETHNKN